MKCKNENYSSENIIDVSKSNKSKKVTNLTAKFSIARNGLNFARLLIWKFKPRKRKSVFSEVSQKLEPMKCIYVMYAYLTPDKPILCVGKELFATLIFLALY